MDLISDWRGPGIRVRKKKIDKPLVQNSVEEVYPVDYFRHDKGLWPWVKTNCFLGIVFGHPIVVFLEG